MSKAQAKGPLLSSPNPETPLHSPVDAAWASAILQALLSGPRVTERRGGVPDRDGRCVVYWMQRAQRGIDNHAVNLAVSIANELKLPLVVYFAAISNFPHANLRHYVFLNQGLPDIEHDLAARNITFLMRRAPHESHERLLADVRAAILVGDENPMRAPESWRREITSRIRIPFYTVDTDVIVPSKLIPKRQFGAYTIRPRLYRALPEFLIPYENPHAEHAWERPPNFQSDSVHEDITRGWPDLDRTVKPVEAWKGGTHAALARLKLFTTKMLPNYETQRNHPETDGTSTMSPYLHYGHLGPQTIALAVDAAAKADPQLQSARDSYFNELIAWRELSVNFVRTHPDTYDTAACAEEWSKKTIAEHAGDQRDRIYSLEQLERAETYDDLWNAAQVQMLRHGWMHNYLRMYWAKKILEWTPDVDTAMAHTIYLNDKYFIDGRDPNGYSGCAWAIVGKFDRAWGSRPVFGKRRYMSGVSTARKFDSKTYIRRVSQLPE